MNSFTLPVRSLRGGDCSSKDDGSAKVRFFLGEKPPERFRDNRREGETDATFLENRREGETDATFLEGEATVPFLEGDDAFGIGRTGC